VGLLPYRLGSQSNSTFRSALCAMTAHEIRMWTSLHKDATLPPRSRWSGSSFGPPLPPLNSAIPTAIRESYVAHNPGRDHRSIEGTAFVRRT
jgi:hypothetical protein